MSNKLVDELKLIKLDNGNYLFVFKASWELGGAEVESVEYASLIDDIEMLRTEINDFLDAVEEKMMEARDEQAS